MQVGDGLANLGRIEPGHDPDRRQLDHIRAEGPQGRAQAARLSPGSGDHDPLAVKRPALQPGDRVAARGDRPEEQDRRGAQPGLGDRRGQLRKGRGHRPLGRVGAALDCSRGFLRIAPAGPQGLGDPWEVLHAHVQDERAREPGERLPVERRLVLLRVLVAGDERDGGRVVAMGDRDPRVRGRRDARRHARHHLELDPRPGERLCLLAAAAEDERVTALEPHHAAPMARALDHQFLDPLLRRPTVPGLLADVDQLGLRTRTVEDRGRNQAVVEHDVGGGDQLHRLHRYQAGIAGAGADEVHDARARTHRASPAARSRMSAAPAPSIRSASASPSAAGCSGSPATRSRTHSLPSGSPA